jgi:hypothetical protein
MQTIYKYILRASDENIAMPIGAKIVSVGVYSDELCLWAEVDTTAMTELVVFDVYHTGIEITPNKREFIGTAISDKFELVFHVYKRID